MNPEFCHKNLTISVKVDESWSYVGRKKQQRWLWWVEEVSSGQVVAFVLGRRTNQTFRQLQELLLDSGIAIKLWITDAWWTYFDCLDQSKRVQDKSLMQSLERKHLTLRTRIKRLTRKTICFSKSIQIHDSVIGLFINRFFFNQSF